MFQGHRQESTPAEVDKGCVFLLLEEVQLKKLPF